MVAKFILYIIILRNIAYLGHVLILVILQHEFSANVNENTEEDSAMNVLRVSITTQSAHVSNIVRINLISTFLRPVSVS